MYRRYRCALLLFLLSLLCFSRLLAPASCPLCSRCRATCSMHNYVRLQAMLNKAHIKLNAKKLYAADGHAVKVGAKGTGGEHGK